MSVPYKPESYPTVSPYLIVDHAEAVIAFLATVFGATELRRFSTAPGRIEHAEVRVGDSVVMLADGDAGQGWPPVPANVHVYVPDVDQTYQAALSAGAVSVQEPTKKDDPDRRAGITDPGGTTWWIATKVE